MKKLLILCLLISYQIQSQTDNMKSDLPYQEIPDHPESYSAGSVVARMVDGLGFRYYWATEGLTPKDLSYKPSDKARTSAETIDHIYVLSKVIVNATLKKPNVSDNKEAEMDFEEKRKHTLENIKTVADILRNSEDISQFKIIFSDREFPFWNGINGPIEDAVWHCGQLVSFRRSSGNPFNSKANVFTGKAKK